LQDLHTPGGRVTENTVFENGTSLAYLEVMLPIARYLWPFSLLLVTPCLMGQSYVPLTPGARARDYLKDSFNPIYLVTGSAGAAIGQWRDSPHEWGQGGTGFGRRLASSYAQHLTTDSLLFATSSLLHEDNRYVPSRSAGVKARIAYALKSAFQARHDDGSVHFSISRISSMAGSSLISRTWQPPSSGKLSSAGINFGSALGSAMRFQVAREFLPFLWHRQ